MRIVINGIGVAGPALAYWLNRSGHEVVIVEQAPRLRTAGYIVDFWGIGYDIVEQMGLIDEVRALGYQVREVRYVDKDGKKKGGFNTDIFKRLTNGRFTSVRRSDISATIYRAIEGKVETIFGDSVASIDDSGDILRVGFDHAPERLADIVVGADGLHSRVRSIIFGNEAEFETSLDYHVAAFEAKGYAPRDELIFISHGLPGRQISRFSMREDSTLFLFVFRNKYMEGAGTGAKEILHRVFDGAGWEWPQIATELDRATDIYIDSVSQIRMEHWTRDRIALAGDAGACVSLMAGEGTGLAIAEGYVLAGELQASGGDIATAFARYEQRLMPLLRTKQQAAAKFASSFAPGTALGIAIRNQVTRLMGLPLVADLAIGRAMRDDIELPRYDF